MADGGYRIYEGNQALQIPLVQRLVDPGLFPRDPFVATLPGYSAPIWWAIARASSLIPLEPLLLILFAAEKVCLLLAAASFARAVRPQSVLAPWAGATLLALGMPSLLGSGGGKVTSSYFEQTAASIPFFLWAFAAIVQGKRWRWALFSAVGTSLNPMYGVYALAYSGLGIGWVHRRAWPRWVVPLVLLAGLSGPAVLFAARSHQVEAANPSLWLAAAAARFPDHLLPLRWAPTHFAGLGLLALAVLAFAFRRPESGERRVEGRQPATGNRRPGSEEWRDGDRQPATGDRGVKSGGTATGNRQPATGDREVESGGTATGNRRPADEQESSGNRFVLAATICSLGWLALSFMAAYVLRSPGLLVLHPARGTDFWYAAGGLFLVAYFASQTELGDSARRAASVLGLLASLLLIRASVLPQLHLVAGALLLLLLHPRVWDRLSKPVAPQRAAAGLVGLALLFCAVRVAASYRSQGFFDLYAYGASPATREVAQWASTHTDRGALFVVPPSMDMFRPLARRSVVGTWKDGSAILWHRPFVTEWIRRMHALGRPVIPEKGRERGAGSIYPTGWTDQQLGRLCRRFGADFCVLPSSHPTAFPVAFQGKLGLKVVQTPPDLSRPRSLAGARDDMARWRRPGRAIPD